MEPTLFSQHQVARKKLNRKLDALWQSINNARDDYSQIKGAYENQLLILEDIIAIDTIALKMQEERNQKKPRSI